MNISVILQDLKMHMR